jgi:hypothetical protein
MGKHGEGGINQMANFAFGCTILFMGIRTRDTVGNACGFEIHIKSLIFTTPVEVKCLNFAIKFAVYHCFKLKENRINFTLNLQKINPSIAGIIINKENKVFMS